MSAVIRPYADADWPAVAVALWQALGFSILGTVPGAFRRPDGSYAGLHLMFLDLR